MGQTLGKWQNVSILQSHSKNPEDFALRWFHMAIFVRKHGYQKIQFQGPPKGNWNEAVKRKHTRSSNAQQRVHKMCVALKMVS